LVQNVEKEQDKNSEIGERLKMKYSLEQRATTGRILGKPFNMAEIRTVVIQGMKQKCQQPTPDGQLTYTENFAVL
jgi:hypothetical protein